MKYQVLIRSLLAVSVVAGVSLVNMKTAHGELVFDDDLNTENNAPAAVNSASPRIEERQDMTRSEMMRRQRLREELKNEDLLSQKLEELRLKDEMKRTQKIIGSGIDKSGVAEDISSQPVQSQPVQVEAVGSAVVQQPAQQMMAVPSIALNGTSTAPMSSVDEKNDESSEEDQQRVSITGRGGLSSITGSVYDVESKYAAGVGINVDVTDHIGFTAGYTYSSYALGAGSALSYPTGFNYNSYMQKLNLNDNVIDLGVRAYLMGIRSKVRPFVGAGGAYRKGYINYDDQTVKLMKQYNVYTAQDVEISGFTGFIEAGLEFKLTKSISLTGSFKYFNVLSSKQSNPLNPYGFLNNSGYGYMYPGSLYYGGLGNPYYGYNNDVRGQAGDTLSKNNFYQLTAGISVSF